MKTLTRRPWRRHHSASARKAALRSAPSIRRAFFLWVLLGPLLVQFLGPSFTGTALRAATPEPDDPVAWLQQYLRFDTTNPPGNEHAAIGFLAQILHRHGIATQTFVSPTGRATLVAELAATTSEPTEAARLVLLHHVDVVPAGEGWTVGPFSGDRRDGRIFGRGALDAKGLGIAHLAAFLRLQSLPARDLSVLFVAAADEERGGLEGIRWLLQAHPEVFVRTQGVLNEGGLNRYAGGRLRWWGIEASQKRPLWLRLRATGRVGHASGPFQASATHELIGALSRVLELPQPLVLGEAAWEYFHAIAPFHSPAFQNIFGLPLIEAQAAFDAALQAGTLGRALLPGMENYLVDTTQVTRIDNGNRNTNVIPPRAEATLDVRLLPETDEAEFLDRLKDALGKNIETEILLRSDPVPPRPDDTLFDRLAVTLGDETPVVPIMIPGTTDSRYFRALGIPAYGFSPFVLLPEDSGGVHGADERIPETALLEGVELMTRVVRNLASADRWSAAVSAP